MAIWSARSTASSSACPKCQRTLSVPALFWRNSPIRVKKLLTPAYYDQTLIGQYTRDEESVDMLDIIFSTRVYDVGIYYNIGTYKDQLAALFRTRTPIASMYDTYKNAADTKINQINSIFQVTSGE